MLGIFPVHFGMVYYRLTSSNSFSLEEMIKYPLLIGGGVSILILILNRYLLRATYKSTFNPGSSSILKDLLHGVLITLVYFLMLLIERQTIYQWLPSNPANPEILNVLTVLSKDPFLIALWFGPVLWLGIAFFEEISRVFLLRCSWQFSENKSWIWISMILASALIGAAHIYQGSAGALAIGLKSMVACYYFYRHKRIAPLIISHALYDGIQFALLLVQLSAS